MLKKSTSKSALMVALVTGNVSGGGTVVHAEEPNQAFTLDPMVVTAQRMETRDLDTPAAVEVLNHEQLIATGGNNLQEALKFGTGLMFQSQGTKGTSQGTMNSKIIIRGVEKGTLVLVDGVPLNQSGRYNLEDISTEMVEKVEIIRGGGAVLYGSEATGGVINIITRGKRPNKIKTSFGNYEQQSHAISLQASKLGVSYAYDKIGNIDNISDPNGEDQLETIILSHVANIIILIFVMILMRNFIFHTHIMRIMLIMYIAINLKTGLLIKM